MQESKDYIYVNSGYYFNTFTIPQKDFINRVTADGGNVEAVSCLVSEVISLS
jgi:hypothetical protein